MTGEQALIFLILAVTMTLFILNRWRYDVVAGFALLSAVYLGVVPVEHAFEGFSHPAVITVATVLVISQSLQASGIVELFLRYLALSRASITSQVAANCGITALLSAVMNNVGALALMLPVTMRDAARAGRSASSLLMPLSFASLLGGLVTLIGTPPNIVIAAFRGAHDAEPFHMFDFALVGLPVALAGLLYLVFIGWRLLPKRSTAANLSDTDDFHLASYITEIRVPPDSPLVGSMVADLEQRCENDVAVMAIIRNDRRRLAPAAIERLLAGDVLILKGVSEALQPLFENPGLVESGAETVEADWLKSPEVRVIEAVVMPNSSLEGRSVRSLNLHREHGINLLAVAREGHAARARLPLIRFRVGDVLLLQGETHALKQACWRLGCLALRNRGIEITPKRGVMLTPLLFLAGILAAAFQLVPVQIAFVTVVGALVLLKQVSLREAYDSIEWPIIVLLGFLIPVGEALQTTGATELIAASLLTLAGAAPVWVLLGLVVLTSMLLSDVVHNTPTAVLMAPIAWSLATQLGLDPDGFLMAVAIGAASPYLTPIGHQSNTLVMGPGGYRFGDYWRLGLPLDALILLVAVPLIMLIWL